MENKRVLVVDDDNLILIAMRELLGPMEYEVVTALSGAEALKAVSETKFDLLILDIVMPEMDGFQLCEKIRQTDSHKETPIIMLTAKSSDEDRRKGMEVGANLFLPKPFSPERLLAIIAEALK